MPTMAAAGFALLALVALVALALLVHRRRLGRARAARRARGEPQACTVVVLGDFGRSPRMQQHALALAECGALVTVVAHGGTAPHRRVREHARIVMCEIEPFVLPAALPALAALPLKAIAQAASLLLALGTRAPRADVVLVQNPPAIPTLAVALVVCAMRGARLVIDWHNFGYTVLRVSLLARRGLPARARLGAGARALVAAAEAYERACAVFAAEHLCVSAAMADELRTGWHVRATVLRDRPPAAFAPLDVGARHDVLCRLQHPPPPAPPTPSAGPRAPEPAHASGLLDRLHPPLPVSLALAAEPRGARSFATELVGSPARAVLRADRPAVVLTGTSWGADEDYTILLRALAIIDALPDARPDGRARPRVVVLVTGQGPLRERFEADVREMALTRVHVGTAWLSADDYPKLLACADVGVCLHASTSELDLPMKVVDLFGAGVPVCALEYGCIGELVVDGRTGALFSDAPGLARELDELLAGFPAQSARLEAMRAHVGAWRALGWGEHWRQVAAPVLLGGGEWRRLG